MNPVEMFIFNTKDTRVDMRYTAFAKRVLESNMTGILMDPVDSSKASCILSPFDIVQAVADKCEAMPVTTNGILEILQEQSLPCRGHE